MSLRDSRYRKITTELEKRIRSGIYPRGSALPPRVELMAEFSVARATIDRCIGELRRRNLVISRHGSGTFVKDELHQPYRVAIVNPHYIKYRFPESWEVKPLRHSMLKHKSDWAQLLDYDGIIWVQPESAMQPVIEYVHGHVPQVVINRTLQDEVCVSTDHRGAYYNITRERLDRLPESQVFLLQINGDSAPSNYREAGFLDACRGAQRFYEVRHMPDNFEEKLAELEKLPIVKGKPLLLISTSINNTGAVMCYARNHALEWKKDIFYSDFDNDLPDHVWGIKVTSYIQDYVALFDGAVAELERLLNGDCAGRLHTLIEARRCNGDT